MARWSMLQSLAGSDKRSSSDAGLLRVARRWRSGDSGVETCDQTTSIARSAAANSDRRKAIDRVQADIPRITHRQAVSSEIRRFLATV